MNKLALLLVAASIGASAAAADKNWTPPAGKIVAQAMSDRIMAQHPELLSCTFHGVPPGSAAGNYTMYAGSYPERIGNKDDPDDVDISEKGITIIDPRWHRTKDTVKKFVMMLPLRDKAGENIGEIVLAYKNDTPPPNAEAYYYAESAKLRDGLAKEIPSFASLFEQAKCKEGEPCPLACA
jgi:hypothetical protein